MDRFPSKGLAMAFFGVAMNQCATFTHGWLIRSLYACESINNCDKIAGFYYGVLGYNSLSFFPPTAILKNKGYSVQFCKIILISEVLQSFT